VFRKELIKRAFIAGATGVIGARSDWIVGMTRRAKALTG
jgi:hypothetical protein